MKRTSMKRKRVKRDEAHLSFVRQLPCLSCLGEPVEAAHVRFSDASRGKVNPGMGRKDDRYVVPLCVQCHRTGPDAQHNGSERAFWERRGIDVLSICAALREVSGNVEAGWRIVRTAREAAT